MANTLQLIDSLILLNSKLFTLRVHPASAQTLDQIKNAYDLKTVTYQNQSAQMKLWTHLPLPKLAACLIGWELGHLDYLNKTIKIQS